LDDFFYISFQIPYTCIYLGNADTDSIHLVILLPASFLTQAKACGYTLTVALKNAQALP